MSLHDGFKKQKELMMGKYDAAICGISNFNNVDKGVAFDMLVYNYKAVCKGDYSEIKRGGGVVDFAELGADIKKLDEARR